MPSGNVFGSEVKMSFIDEENARIFGEAAQGWWDPSGPFKVLHQMGSARLTFIEGEVKRRLGRSSLEGLRVLDIGTGGGLVAEALAKAGALVVALDAAPENIEVAKAHASSQGFHIDYRVGDLSAAEGEAPFDLVVALEVVEHVVSPVAFIGEAAQLVAPKGLMVLSTLNRTCLSYVLGIFVAENIVGWAPKGAHTWDQFVKPSEMEVWLRGAGLTLTSLKGMSFNPLFGSWTLTGDVSMNYILSAQKLA